MGEMKIEVNSIPIGKTVREWYKLNASKDKKKKGAVSGALCLEITKEV
jgi:hypothetical protein